MPNSPALVATDCPADESLLRLLADDVDPAGRHELIEHLAQCSLCRELVGALARDESRGDGPARTGAAPTRLARYIVVSEIGRGGMGVVYEAYDPELDRRVAVKLLRRGLVGSPGSTLSKPRLLREAQALAKLNHPSVVGVYDAGAVDGEVWIAMELVAGRTLGAWSEEQPRAWRDVLAVLQQAASGLAAAHGAGLLHRDFKADNVMVDTDGRARVMDFGLARAQSGDGLSSPHADPLTRTQAQRVGLASSLTQTGALVGTPAYMSPEQLQGCPADTLTDQFSFCVTLWEALYGQRPFVAGSLHELSEQVSRGAIRPPPTSRGVPTWLRRVCERGLSADPQRRFPDMSALIAALRRGQIRARLRTGLAAAGAVAAVAAVVMGARWYDHSQRVAACADEGATAGEVWHDARRTAVQDALRSTGLAYGEMTAQKVAPWLDDYARALREHGTQACLDGTVRGRWDADTLDRSRWCLEDRRMSFSAVLEELQRPDAGALSRAISIAARLPEVSTCNDPVLLAKSPPPPDRELRRSLSGVRAQLAKAVALGFFAHYEESLRIARNALEEAEAIGWPPLIAAARNAEAEALYKSGKYVEASDAYVASYREAVFASEWRIADSSARRLVRVIGVHLGRHSEGRTWALHAELAASFSGDPQGLSEANRLSDLGTLHQDAGEYDDARQLFEAALRLEKAALGDDHPNVATRLSNLAIVLRATSQPEEARVLQERALALRERAYGPTHPEVAESLVNLANVLQALGSTDEARAAVERALRIWPEDHPGAAYSLNTLGGLYVSDGAYEQAIAAFEKAITIWTRRLGPEHSKIAYALNNIAVVRSKQGKHEQARGLYERALAINEKALGDSHPNVGLDLLNLGLELRLLGEIDAATEAYKRALPILEAAFGDAHTHVAKNLIGLSRCELAAGHAGDALGSARRALAIYDGVQGTQASRAEAHFMLARTMVATGGDRGAAMAEAEKARASLRAHKEPHRKGLEEVETWIEQHRGAG